MMTAIRRQVVSATVLTVVPLLVFLIVADAYAGKDYTQYVNMVQNANAVYHTEIHRTTLMRYPCGRIGLWSVDQGEFADCISRGLRLYPCIDTIVNKDSTDWRDTISGNPSVMNITFRNDVPAKGSAVDLTVTPHVSCYRYRLASGSSFKAITMTVNEGDIHSWDNKVWPQWADNSFKVIDDQTVQACVSGFKNATVYYYIRFNVPSVGRGTFSGSAINDGASSITGDDIGGYLKFNASDVVAAVAVSHTSMAQAKKYFNDEFADMDFDAAAGRLKNAWIAKLGKIEAQGPDIIMKELYTALYTVYVNLIDVSDNPYYTSYKPLLTIASSDFWQYVLGYMRCSWDMSRGVYPLMALIDPEVFTHILNTYQAQFDRDGKFFGNWDPFSDNKWDSSGNYAPNIALLASLQNVTGVDYAKFKNSARTTIEKRYNPEFFSLGYIPIGKGKDCGSYTLEHSPQIQGLAILARTVGDTGTYDQYYKYRTNYKNIYDAANKRFRAKNPDGSWGPLRGGFFEGSGEDYVFAVPHDPYGILALYGPSDAVARIEEYVRKKSDYNDYKLIYEYLPIFADRADVTQKLVRTSHVPKFDHLNMTEGFWPRSQGCYYTDNAGPLVCCIIGLYWIPTSGATWMITTPSIDHAVIHGKTDITIETVNNSPANHYISSIKLNDVTYPSFLISGKKLVSGNQKLTLSLTDKASKIGNIYLSSADGEVMNAATDNSTYLDFDIDPVATSCSAKVYCTVKPASISLNGADFSNWSYDSTSKLVSLKGVTKGLYRVVVASCPESSPTSQP